jgi:hypothetical protein
MARVPVHAPCWCTWYRYPKRTTLDDEEDLLSLITITPCGHDASTSPTWLMNHLQRGFLNLGRTCLGAVALPDDSATTLLLECPVDLSAVNPHEQHRLKSTSSRPTLSLTRRWSATSAMSAMDSQSPWSVACEEGEDILQLYGQPSIVPCGRHGRTGL